MSALTVDAIGFEPQPSHVVAYHAQQLVGTARGERDDLYITPKKVVVLGEDKSHGDTEFVFDETFGSNISPLVVTQSVLPTLVHSLLQGVNGLLLVLGQSNSGKSELAHGAGPSTSSAAGGAAAWDGLAEHAISDIFDALPSDTLSQAEDRYSVRMQFINIVEERVQDLTQPNPHAQDLELHERPDFGTEVVGADEFQLKSKAQGLRLYRAARDELHRLERYHGVNASSQCCILTLTLVRHAAAKIHGPHDTGLRSSLSLVELPGSERLAVDRAQLHVSEVPMHMYMPAHTCTCACPRHPPPTSRATELPTLPRSITPSPTFSHLRSAPSPTFSHLLPPSPTF